MNAAGERLDATPETMECILSRLQVSESVRNKPQQETIGLRTDSLEFLAQFDKMFFGEEAFQRDLPIPLLAMWQAGASRARRGATESCDRLTA